MIIWLLFAVSLASPGAAILYSPALYSWGYDSTLKYSYYVQKCEMIIELGTILISAVFYIFVIIILYSTRKRFLTQSNCKTELKVLIQAIVITLYCIVLNFLWHHSQMILPSNIWSYMALNMMWILNSGVYPLVYFIVNRDDTNIRFLLTKYCSSAIRERLTSRKSRSQVVSVVGGAMPSTFSKNTIGLMRPNESQF
ncbi:unnamed protein product [Strongylus vulgaris]|uniref:G-protein coupled receptors family 1 profile domain-containing protein n=1 Tax=Strongylus vulgaris TaxID=40348 RepID=A0A3P7IJ92_STRVU|nr:unnamed protein product [Strongylus vulgaris]